MKRRTKQILNQIIQEEYDFLNMFSEPFWFYYVEGKSFADKYGHQKVLNRDLLFNLYRKLKYNNLSDDLLNLSLIFAFNDKGKQSHKVIVAKLYFERNDIRKHFKLSKLVTSTINHKKIALFEPSNEAKYFTLKCDSKYFTVANIERIAFKTIDECINDKRY